MNHKAQTGAVTSWWHRLYGQAGPAWLITLFVGQQHVCQSGCAVDALLQARAVVDDFGTLVIVRGWQ